MALAGCQTVAEAPEVAKAPSSYSASGTEPFWNATVKEGKIHFRRLDGSDIIMDSYVGSQVDNGYRYTGSGFAMDILQGPCSDGMSDRNHKDRVSVSVGRDKFVGCGGGLSAPAVLSNSTWTIVDIDGVAPVNPDKASIHFGDVRMSGTVGCNRFGAGYDFMEGKLRFGPAFSTMMACPEPLLQQQEGAFLAILEKLETTEFLDDGTALLTATNGSKTKLKPAL